MVVRGVGPLHVIEASELGLGRNRGLQDSWSITRHVMQNSPPDLDVRAIQASSYDLPTER